MLTKFNFDKLAERVTQMKRDLPRILANDTKNFFIQNYNQQEWNGAKWQEVQRRIPGTKAYKYPKKGSDSRQNSAILVRSGKLRRDVANSLEHANWDSIKFTVHNDYGVYHNEGGKNLPQRRFMGDTPALRKRQLDKIKQYMQKLWRG